MERNAEHGVPVSEFLLRHGNAPTCLQTYSNTLCTWENTHTHTHTPTRKRSLWMETNVEKHGAACWSIYKVQAGGVCIVCQHACVCVCMYVCVSASFVVWPSGLLLCSHCDALLARDPQCKDDHVSYKKTEVDEV